MWDSVVEVLFALPKAAFELKESERLGVFQLRLHLHVNFTTARTQMVALPRAKCRSASRKAWLV